MRLLDGLLLIWFGAFSCYIFAMMWSGVYWYHEPNRAILITETVLTVLMLIYGIYRITEALGKRKRSLGCPAKGEYDADR